MLQSNIVYISVPESARLLIEDTRRLLIEDTRHEPDFVIDPSIPMPVELPAGTTTLDLETLTPEMIIAGMMRVLSDGDSLDDLALDDGAYYRAFILALKPNILNEFSGAAIFKARNGDFALAEEICGVLEGIFPDSPDVAQIRSYVQVEKMAACEGKADAPVSGTPFSGRMTGEMSRMALDDELFHAAYELIRKDKIEESLEPLRAFLARDERGGGWNGHFMLGWALRRLGRYEEGAASFRRALETGAGAFAPAHLVDTLNELAICLMETGRLSEARHALEHALREDSENVKIISNLAVLALKDGRRDEAEGFFRTAIEIDPDDPVAREYFSRV
jgi:tetratricopeptide (TPR) repeat protein